MGPQSIHRCLQVDEILSNVLDNILTADYRTVALKADYGSGTLAILARTCKLFSEPALNRLWYCIPGLSRIVQCLPKDAWYLERLPISFDDSDPRAELRLIRLLTAEDYLRFYFYSRRVRVLLEERSSFLRRSIPLHHLTLPSILSKRPHESYLMPNLARVEMPLKEFNDLALHPTAVITPGLKWMQLCIERDVYESSRASKTDASWRNFGLLLSKAGRSLDYLTIWVDYENENEPFSLGAPEGLIGLLRRLKQVQTLQVAPVEITAKVLRRLLGLRTLRTLSFTMSTDEMEDFVEVSDKHPNHICSLHSLYMRIEDLDFCYRLLNQVAQPSLRNVSIIRHASARAAVQEETTHLWDIDLFLADLSRKDFFINLNHLTICHPKSFSSRAGMKPRVSRKTIEPLLLLKNLEGLRVSLYGNVDLDKEILTAMAKAWPNLHGLELHERTVQSIPRITLLDVLHFTSSCLHLQELEIRFDATREDYEVKDLQGLSPSKSLELLQVCTSPIGDVKVVAQLLTVALPKLQQLTFGWEYDDVSETSEEHGEFTTPLEAKYCDNWVEVGNDMNIL